VINLQATSAQVWHPSIKLWDVTLRTVVGPIEVYSQKYMILLCITAEL